ncbi:MAG TPA: VOC family protein [Solirubrobacteraceae bacterium]|nr:VOC family protein [Solirubrobacteraceae bacterium]
MARLRQAVIAARDLDSVAGRLRAELGLGEPFSDPAVSYFGLRNAVFGLGDTFLEVVSPVREDTAAGRLIARRGGDCGYMLMFQVDDLARARSRAREAGVREVFEVAVEDMAEVHLHPADMRGAIVSMSEPRPPESWRWGGPGWPERSAPVTLAGATVAVADAGAVAARWATLLGGPSGVAFVQDPGEGGLVEIALEAPGAPAHAVEIGSVTVLRSGGR